MSWIRYLEEGNTIYSLIEKFGFIKGNAYRDIKFAIKFLNDNTGSNYKYEDFLDKEKIRENRRAYYKKFSKII